MQKKEPGFHIAAFWVDGSLQGKAFWPSSSLSEKSLEACETFLKTYGDSFDGERLASVSHIAVKFTAAKGCAMIVLSVGTVVASSLVLLGGINGSADVAALQSFVKSLRRLPIIKNVADPLDKAFDDALHMEERPLMVVVPIPVESISDEDHALVRDLSVHLAGAFFGSLRVS